MCNNFPIAGCFILLHLASEAEWSFLLPPCHASLLGAHCDPALPPRTAGRQEVQCLLRLEVAASSGGSDDNRHSRVLRPVSGASKAESAAKAGAQIWQPHEVVVLWLSRLAGNSNGDIYHLGTKEFLPSFLSVSLPIRSLEGHLKHLPEKAIAPTWSATKWRCMAAFDILRGDVLSSGGFRN